MKIKSNALDYANKYMDKHYCRNCGTEWRLNMYSADDNGKSWAELQCSNMHRILIERKTKEAQ